eukprot:7886462-Pyramimonas_sp.AAC.1
MNDAPFIHLPGTRHSSWYMGNLPLLAIWTYSLPAPFRLSTLILSVSNRKQLAKRFMERWRRDLTDARNKMENGE